jgi:hypothetical protein
MTALKKYQRLEATGLWRDAPGARLREVIVGLRDATIVLSDPRSELPLTQWSLPAILRVNPGKLPALYAPGEEAGEELELDDTEMIAALEVVHRAVERRRPHPGRLRAVVLGVTALAVVGLVVFWLPAQVKSYTVGMLPAATRADLGELALADLGRLTGSPCKSVPGRQAATALAQRLSPAAPPRIEVLRDGLTTPAHLPGGLILLPAALIEGSDGPDAVAGHVLDEMQRDRTGDGAGDDLALILSHLGLGPTLRLLTTGAVQAGSMTGFGEAFLATPRAADPDPTVLLAAFKTAGVSSAPYGATLRDAPDSARRLIDEDPFPLGTPSAVLSDESWLELQAICNE